MENSGFRIDVKRVERIKGEVVEVYIVLDNRTFDCADDQEEISKFQEVYGVIFIKEKGKIIPVKKFHKGVEYLVYNIGSLWIPKEYYAAMVKRAGAVFGSRSKKSAKYKQPDLPLGN